jgi:predicted transposase/invertase (TIGR01784 family)
MPGIYINPYTDFGFKKLFGEDASKDLLLDFLNELLPPEHKIAELSLVSPHMLPDVVDTRNAVFDIHCSSVSGEKFIVEMQKAKQKYFKDRTVFYSTFPIRNQAQSGEWDFALKAVYCVGILDFTFDKQSERQDVLTRAQLKDQHHEVFYDKLTFLYLQMPYFTKGPDELETHFDKWLYFLKNLETFDQIPTILREPIFERGFDLAALANMSVEDRLSYERSKLSYLDLKNVIDTAREEGVEKGIELGKDIGKKEGIDIGKKQGIDIGKKEGIQEARAKLRQRLRDSGMSDGEIDDLLGPE